MRIPRVMNFASRGLFWYFKLGFMFLFLGYLFVSIVNSAIEEKDVNIIIERLGEEFMSPLENAQEYAIDIQNSENLNLFKSIWSYWGFYYNLYIIYLWIKIMKWIVLHFVIMDDSRRTNAYLGGIGLFLIIQYLYLALNGKDPNILWQSWIEIFKGLNHLFSNTSFEFKEVKINNSCYEDACVI